jgi:endo-1,4-beta-xylanase
MMRVTGAPGWQRVTAGIATAVMVAGAFAVTTPAMAAASTLKAAAEAQGRYFGTEVTGNMIYNSTITNLAAQQFDMVTPAMR